MTLQEAIVARHSVRQYTEQPIEAEKIRQLQELIDQCNRDGNLHIQIVTDEPNAFSSIIAHYSKFRGVRNYIAMICKKGDDVNLGYYGEKVVLLAQKRFAIFASYAPIDLGIAKCHFEIGAGEGSFEWV